MTSDRSPSPEDAYAKVIDDGIRAHLGTVSQLLRESRPIVQLGGLLVNTYRAGGKVLLFGNGGSAADAQHIATELVGRFNFDRPSLPALALTVNTSALTAIANDYDFSRVFARQVEGLGVRGDVAIGLSTSGTSKNVLEGLVAARAKGMATVALTGAGGGTMNELADLCIRVPSNATPRIQEAHILVGHLVCEIVERALFGHLEARQ